MNKSEFSSIKNTVLSSKPSRAIGLFLMVLFVFIMPLVSFGQSQTFNSSGSFSFTVPCGVTSITVKVWGGGGGGHNTYKVGGGGGAFAQSTFNVTSGTSYALTIGAGAASGTGDNGGDSSFGSIVIAKGGNGGNGGNNAGRGGQASASIGDIKYSGGNGGTSNGNGGAGGGAAAGTTNDGNNGVNGSGNTPGNGGNGINGGGNGGNGGNINNSGGNGASPGGGGGERGNNGGSSGSGGDGKIEVTYSSSFQNYCTPSFNSGVEPITNVTFAGINNTTTASTSGAASLETFCNLSASVVQGSTNAISVKGNTAGDYIEYIKVYIDWDQNGVFGNNANEKYDLGTIRNSTGIDTKSATGNIAVPLTALLGATMMRVVKTYNSSGTNSNNPCYSGNDYGQAEDYSVTVTSPCPTYSLTGSNTATATCVSDGTSTITLKGTAASLPVGTYTVTYNTDVPYQSGKTATMTVSTAGTATFTATRLTLYSGTSGISTVTVTNISLGSCSNAVSVNNTAAVTVYATPVGGGVYSGNTPICLNSSTGNMTLGGGYVGNIVRWEKRLLPSTTWTSISNTTAVYSENPSVAGTWEYRAVVGNGSCTEVYSSAFSVTVNPASAGGTVSGGTTPICQGSSIGTLTLSGHTGTVVNWEKRVNSGSWGYAGGSATTFSDNPAAGTWDYRAVVQSGSCSIAYSSTVTIVVDPTPVGGYVDYATTPVCINTAVSLHLSGSSGSIVRWEKRLNSGLWSSISNTSTNYSETPSVAGTWEYRAVVGSGSCTTVNSAAFSVTVNPELTITLTNANATICQNTTTVSFAYSATTGSPAACSVDFDSVANTAGFADSSYIGLGGASGTFSVNVPWGVAAGVYNATLTLKTNSPSCTSTVSYLITVTVGVSTPTIGAKTQPNCSTSKGSVVLNGLPASGTIYQTGDVVTNFPITGTTMTISGLAAGTYQFAASNGSCTSSATGNVVITPAVTNTWNGSAWSNGTPNSSQKIVFSGNYPPAVDLDGDIITGCSCMVTGNTNVVIKSGKTLAITNEVTVVGSGSGPVAGSLTFENNASLVQINDAAINSGNIIYKRTTSSVLTSDYTYWSSPVTNQKLNISSSYVSGMFYSYNDFAVPEDWKEETADSEMVVGKGYIIRGPQITGLPPAPGLYYATFKGEPNNGIKTISIGPKGTSNLLGNPYPSAIDADAFLATNSTLVEGTIYLWTHNTAIQLASDITNGTAGSGVLAYTSDDYASYNVTGGVGTGIGNWIPGTPPTEKVSNRPTGKIAAGQAFFTTSLGAGTVTFNNAMRLSSGGAILDNSQFFKTKNPNKKTTNIIEKHRIWLNLKNSEGAFKQTLVGYITDATNEYDSRFDGESFDANEFVDFYSINEDKNLVIQGRALPFDEKDEVPLGYKTTIEGNFTINIDETDGLLTNQSVFLEDKLTNTVVDLKVGNYTFNTAAGTFNDRFVLKYSSKTLTVDEAVKEDGILVVYSNNYKTLMIQNKIVDSTVNAVSLFNMSGQNIAVWDVRDSEQTNIQIPIKDISSGIYIVKVKTTKGESSKKIIIN